MVTAPGGSSTTGVSTRPWCEGYTALFCGVATQDQAGAMTKVLSDRSLFLLIFSLPSLSRGNAHYSRAEYWQGPAWLDQAWFATEGLRRYGFHDLASVIKSRVFTGTAGTQHNDTAPFHEYYCTTRRTGPRWVPRTSRGRLRTSCPQSIYRPAH